MADIDTSTAEALYCYKHSGRDTHVRCSSCDRPLCPDCMVYSPVGVKCNDCARLPRSARLGMTPSRWVKAIGASLVAGTGVGLGYYLLLSSMGFIFFIFFIAVGIGYVVGEAVSRAAGRYHGLETALIAVAGTVWAFVLPPLLTAALKFGPGWDAVVFSLSGRGLLHWLIMGVAGYVGWQRNR